MARKIFWVYIGFLLLMGISMIIFAVVHNHQMKVSFNSDAENLTYDLEVVLLLLTVFFTVIVTPIVILISLIMRNFKTAGWILLSGLVNFIMLFLSMIIDMSPLSV